jgi:hypothetical protein
METTSFFSLIKNNSGGFALGRRERFLLGAAQARIAQPSLQHSVAANPVRVGPAALGE